MDAISDFGTALVDAGLIYPTGVTGVTGRSGPYGAVVRGLHDLVTTWGAQLEATEIQFPPIVNRTTFEQDKLHAVVSRPHGRGERLHGRQP